MAKPTKNDKPMLDWTTASQYINNVSKLLLYGFRCTEEIIGKSEDILTGGQCEIDEATGVYPATCKFIPTAANGAKASLLFAEHLDSVGLLRLYIANSNHYLCPSNYFW